MIVNCVFFGMTLSCSMRVGFHVGQKNTKMARYVVKVCMMLGLAIAVVFLIFFDIFHGYISYLFSDDPQINIIVSDSTYVFTGTIIALTIFSIFNGPL